MSILIKKYRGQQAITADIVSDRRGEYLITIHQRKSGRRTTTDKYSVSEFPHPERGHRCFQVQGIHTSGPEMFGTRVVYWVEIAPDENLDRCDCPGHESRSYCKHVATIRHFLGEMPPLPPPPKPTTADSVRHHLHSVDEELASIAREASMSVQQLLDLADSLTCPDTGSAPSLAQLRDAALEERDEALSQREEPRSNEFDDLPASYHDLAPHFADEPF